jgi:hypothetical protein
MPRSRRTKRTRRKQKGAGRTYVIIIPYRARGDNHMRKGQLKECLESIVASFTKYKRNYKVMVVEQNNDFVFNFGLVKNIGFVEAEKQFTMPKMYMHMNCDYKINVDMEFPKEIDAFSGPGFLDVYTMFPGADAIIGSSTVFDADTYKKVNGFPNNLVGWGAEDGLLNQRVKIMKVPHIENTVTNNGWIQNPNHEASPRNGSKHDGNWGRGSTNLNSKGFLKSNGVNSCVYKMDGDGEFNDASKGIRHIKVNFEEVKE